MNKLRPVNRELAAFSHKSMILHSPYGCSEAVSKGVATTQDSMGVERLFRDFFVAQAQETRV